MSKNEQREQLIELRHQLIGVLHTQPHTIYNNETIEKLLEVQPKSLDELATVKGFPRDGKRIKCFGKAVIAIFNPEFKAALEIEEKEKSTTASEAAKKMTQFVIVASIALAGFSNSTAMANVENQPVNGTAVTSGAAIESDASLLASKAIEAAEVDGEVQSTAALQLFYQESKKQSEENWDKLCADVAAKKVAKEEAKRRADEARVEAANAKFRRLKNEAIGQIKSKVVEARKEALRVAREAKKEAARIKREKAKREAARLKAEAEAKIARSGANAQPLANYQKYTVGDEGRSEWKSWMGYRSITCTTSDQWKLQHSGQAVTGKFGIRTVNGRYCIAVGSHYASKIGTKIDVILESGRVLCCILADQKSDSDTDSLNRYHVSDGSYVEFVVDSDAIDSRAKNAGDFDKIPEFNGKVKEIRVAK